MKNVLPVVCLVSLLGWVGCSGGSGGAKADPAGPVAALPTMKDGMIRVQHILVGFKDSVPGKNVTRSLPEAEQLAKELLAKAQAGEDFDTLVRDHTDDSAPGIYTMANNGVDTRLIPGDVIPRAGMVKSFGDTSFQLEVGQIGIADYNVTDSPFGWHVIKRLE
jgi:foldase protein PrsA